MILRPKVLLLVTAACVGSICSLVACHSDRRDSYYASLADARKDGAIDRGWIPDYLPESAHTIHEVHDMSPSRGWCAFEFIPSDSTGLRKSVQSVDGWPPSVKRIPSPGKPWWPPFLEGSLDAEKIRQGGFDLYTVVSADTPSTTEAILFAIDWTKGRGFFYRARVSPSGSSRG